MPLEFRNPISLIRALGHRLQSLRLARGWTREELAERSGVALSTLKLLETRGQGSLQRLARVAVALGVEGDLRDVFLIPQAMASIEAVKGAERKRAPRRKRKEESGGFGR